MSVRLCCGGFLKPAYSARRGSRSPSTRDGQPLELLHYAFDWGGADVPQLMEALCNRGKDGQPWQVVEITSAASRL